MTSYRPDRTGIDNNEIALRKKHPDVVTMPQWFRQHGYTVGRVGKLYHYGVPSQIGTSGLDDPTSWDFAINPRGRDKDDEQKIFSLVPGRFGGTVSWLAAEGSDDEQTDARGASEAIGILEKHRNDKFFLAVGFYRPHTPYVAPKKYFDLYPTDTLKVAAPVSPDQPGVPAIALHERIMPEWRMTDAQRRQAVQGYYASITFMDAQVGRLLDALDRLGLADRTVVAFISDHGYQLGEHGLWQKRTLFEQSLRVPMIIADPRATSKGTQTRALAELVDVYPTLTALAGLPTPEGVDGVSLSPTISNPNEVGKGFAISQITRQVKRRKVTGYSLRTDRWRYTEWDEGREGIQLYDHDADPEELSNLADQEKWSQTRQQLADELRRRLGRNT
jgi:uncharacterized sulfatase